VAGSRSPQEKTSSRTGKMALEIWTRVSDAGMAVLAGAGSTGGDAVGEEMGGDGDAASVGADAGVDAPGAEAAGADAGAGALDPQAIPIIDTATRHEARIRMCEEVAQAHEGRQGLGTGQVSGSAAGRGSRRGGSAGPARGGRR
jgi:hypothetical protein